MRIHVLALDGAFDTGLATILDTLSIANDLAGSAGAASTSFEITVMGVRCNVRTSHGLSVPVVPVTQCGRPDVVLIPALGAKCPRPCNERSSALMWLMPEDICASGLKMVS
jgi:transcriptional regulator GlxA family with amidase domain